MREKIITALNILVIGLGIYLIIYTVGFDEDPDYMRLARVMGTIAVYIFAMTRRMHRVNVDMYKVYKNDFGHIIKDAFSNDLKKYNRLMKCIDLYVSNRYNTSIKKFEKLLEECETNNEFAVVQFFMGCVNMDMGYINDAIENFEDALDSNPTIVEAINNLGVCHKVNGDLNEAVKCFENVLKYSTKESYTYVNLAECYMTQADWQKTLFYAQGALQANSTETEAMAVAYLACERMNDWNNAKRYKDMYFVNGGTKDDLEELVGELELSV